MKHKKTIYKLVLGGALIGGALFVYLNFARGYNRQTTHPALTDEAVDFYNLNFPDNLLAENDKRWLIQGAIDEDLGIRSLNHFYDPVYNQGWQGYTSSKKWAYSSNLQRSFTESQVAGFAAMVSNDNLSPDDHSYQRALYDYTVGDRKRAMIAMGHIMHLLEDANVPDHTRGDTHLPFESTESPYEITMAKWNPGNLDIASKIFTNGTKPVLLSNLGNYFDKIAKYSNNYFFSEDTILSNKYPRPRELFEKIIDDRGIEFIFAMGRDRDGNNYPLYKKGKKFTWRNFTTETKFTVDSSIVLDNYWSRLSKDFVPNGAGALKLFLDQAEKVKREYPKNGWVYQESSLIEKFLGFLGFSGWNGSRLKFDPALIDSILSGQMVLGESVINPPTSLPSSATPLPTPSVTPLTSLTPSPTSSPSTTPTHSPSPSPIQLSSSSNGNNSGGGSSGGSGGGTASTPTPTPTPTPSPSSSPTPTPSLSSSPTPSPQPEQSEAPLEESGAPAVVINEIAWMGTEESDGDEWLELYNTSSKSVDLTGWHLGSLTGENPSPDIVFASKSIDPFGFFLLERTNDTTISDISASQIYTGGLNNDGEVLELRDKNGSLSDLVSKSTDGWYAGKNDKADDENWARFTMERINPVKAGNDSTNWATNNGVIRNGHDAGGNPINGTPGAQNSMFMAENITLTPTPTPTPTPVPGDIVWQSEAPDAYYINQPAIGPDGTIYFGAPNNVTGIPRLFAIGQDGIEKWRHDNEIAGFGVPTTPAISDDGAVYFGHLSSWITALNSDGTLRWQYDASRVNGVSVDESGNVYATSDNKMINKIGPDGSKKWQVQDPLTFGSTPITVSGDEDVYLSFDWLGYPGFYRLRGNDGSPVWQSRPPINTSGAFDLTYDQKTDQFYAAAIGYVISINRSDGVTGSQSFAFGASAITKVAIFEDNLVVGVDFSVQNPASGQAVIALNKAEESKIWTFQVDSRINGQIAVGAAGNLYFATRNGKVYSLDKDGKERWVFDLGAPTELYPVLGENAVFIGVGGASGGKLVKIADY